jgi:hypothetical protein
MSSEPQCNQCIATRRDSTLNERAVAQEQSVRLGDGLDPPSLAKAGFNPPDASPLAASMVKPVLMGCVFQNCALRLDERSAEDYRAFLEEW